jgi:hypothetical protein
MDSRPLSFAPIVVCASRERGGYRYLALTVTWSATLVHSQVTAPSELSRSRLPALLARPSLGSSSLGDRDRQGGEGGGRCGFESPAVPRLWPAGPTGRGSTVEPRCGSDLAVPARLVGWSEPGNEAKGGDTS